MIALPATLAAAFLAYSPGLPGPLLLDDIPQLGSLIAQSDEEPSMLFGNYIMSTSGPLGRPVSMATFIMDAISHGPDTWWWKYDSVMYHLISGLLVAWFTSLLVKLSPVRLPADPWAVGLLVAAFWLLHPLNVSTVLYTVQRMTVLSTLFTFAGLVCYAKGRLAQIHGRPLGWIAIGMAFGLFLPLSVLSKESGLLFVIYCTLAELLICRFRGRDTTRRHLQVLHGALAAGYFAALVFLIVNVDFVLEGYAFRDFTVGERVLTQFRVVVTYISQILVPLPIWMGFFHDDVELSTGLFSPLTTAPSIILIVSLLTGAVVLARRFPLAAFGILFFFASHAMESTIFGLELMFEHRNYAGSVGLLLALVTLGAEAVVVRKAMMASAVILLAGFSFLTWQRSSLWSAPEVMYRHMYAVHPNSPRLNIVLANTNASIGRFDDARLALSRVKRGLGRELHDSYLDCLEYRQIRDPEMRELLNIQTGVVDGYVTSTAGLIVRANVDGQCTVATSTLLEAMDHLLSSRIRSPMDQRAVLFLKAELLEKSGDDDSALETLLQAQQVSSLDALGFYYAADLLARRGHLAEAQSMLRNASRLERTSRVVRNDLAESIYSGIADAYVARQDYKEALSVSNEAASMLPRRVLFVLLSGEVLLHLGDYDGAAAMLERARQFPQSETSNYRPRMERLTAALAGR